MTTTAERLIAEDRYLQAATDEMRRAGLYDEDADYGSGSIAERVLDLLQAWHKQGHSGGSKEMTLTVFDRLVRGKRLAPITSDPEEWMDVSEYSPSSPAMWQNRRQSTLFSHDAGENYYDIDERRNWLRTRLRLGHYGFHLHRSATK